MTVIIVGNANRNSSHRVLAEMVTERGGKALFLQPSVGKEELTYSLNGHEYTVREPIDLADISGAYYGFNSVFSDIISFGDWRQRYAENPLQARFLRREHRAIINSLFAWLDRQNEINVVYPPRQHYWLNVRNAYLQLWSEQDIPIPDSLFTNEPEKAKAFVDEHLGQKVVIKNLTERSDVELLQANDIREHEWLESLKYSPVLIQEYAPGTDVRAYILDGDFIAAYQYEYESWSFKFSNNVDFEEIQLSSQLKEDIERAAEVTDLTFASIDIRFQDDGTFTFLGINSDRTFAMKERAVTALADYLLDQ